MSYDSFSVGGGGGKNDDPGFNPDGGTGARSKCIPKLSCDSFSSGGGSGGENNGPGFNPDGGTGARWKCFSKLSCVPSSKPVSSRSPFNTLVLVACALGVEKWNAKRIRTQAHEIILKLIEIIFGVFFHSSVASFI